MFILWIKKADDPVCVKLTELYPTLWGTMDCSLSGSCPQNSPGMNTGVGLSFPSPGDLPNPGIESGSPALQGDSLPSEPPGKPYTIIVCYFNSFSYRKCVWNCFIPTLCTPRDCISPGFSVHGILQARFFTTNTTWEAPGTECPHVNFPRWLHWWLRR